MKNKDFEQLFSERLYDYRKEPPISVWERIVVSINNTNGRKRMLFWLSPLLLIAIMGVWIFNPLDFSKDEVNNTLAIDTDNPILFKSLTDNNENYLNALKNDEINNQDLEPTTGKNNNESSGLNNIFVPDNNSGGIRQQNSPVTTNISLPENKPKDLLEPITLNRLRYNFNINYNLSDFPKFNERYKDIYFNPENPEKFHYTISLYATPVISRYYYFNSDYGFDIKGLNPSVKYNGYRFGVMLNQQFSNNFRLGVGLHYEHFKHDLYRKITFSSSRISPEVLFEGYRIDPRLFEIFGIPVHLFYNLGSNTKFSLDAFSGLSFNYVMNKRNVEEVFHLQTTSATYNSNPERSEYGPSSFSISFHLGSRATFRLSEDFYIFIQPEFSTSVLSINKFPKEGSLHVYNLSNGFGIKYRF